MNKALIIVDVQNDFLPNGALGVTDGHRATPLLWKLMDDVDIIVFTRDWHPANHSSFAIGTPKYDDGSWPPHCVQGTEGAGIDDWLWDKAIDSGKPVFLINKGYDTNKEAYSGFAGYVAEAYNSDYLEGISDHETVYLAGLLYDLSVREVKIGGLALEKCVKETALDSRNHFGNTTVYLNATRPITYLGGVKAVAELASAGVRLDTREI